MSWHSASIVMDKVHRLSGRYRLPSATIDGLLGEFLAALHETSFKGSDSDTLLGVYHSLGPEAAWHFWGLIYGSLEGGDGELLHDRRALWYETALRLDSRMKRFATIIKRWDEEKAFELQQHEDELQARQDKQGSP
jgi:hypothetical protein